MTDLRRFAALLFACLTTSAVLAQDAAAPATEPAPAAAAEAAPAPAAVAPVAPATAPVPMVLAPITCVEVERLTVADVEGQTDRAAKMPEQSIDIVHERTIAQLQQRAHGIQVVGPGLCPSPASAAVLRSDLVDFRMGNAALRYFVGFGAGTQKVRVNASLVRKDGSIVGQQQIADAKWGGAFGGSNRKGLDDFAAKVAQFAVKAIAAR
jgi:hypothetical protein